MPAVSSVAGKTSSLSSIRRRTYPFLSGGTLTSDNTYYYRTFTTNGSLMIADAPLNIDYWVVGGGGGGGYRSTRFPYYWDAYTGGKVCYVGGAGGAGSNIISGTVTWPSQAINVLIGAGGSSFNNGSASSITASPSISTSALGYAAGIYGDGGDNPIYFGNDYITVGPAYQYSSYPYYYNGGGGAGSGGNGSAVNGGASTSVLGLDIGGGGAGSEGGYEGNDYDRVNFNYWPTYYPGGSGTPGTGGGTGTGSSGSGGNATANRGGGGGGGVSSGGNGGSGIFIVRYLRSAVGG